MKTPDAQPSPDTHQGRTAIVTGAAQGIGAAIARRLAADDFNLVLVDRDDAVLALAQELPSAVGIVADVGSEEAAKTIVTEAVTTWGSLDVLVNNAAVPGPSDEVGSLSRSSVQAVFAVNVLAVADLCRESISWLTASSGVIVNLSSLFADHPVSNGAAYSMSKSAVKNLTQVLARELGSAGIRVNAVAPGYILTEMHRLEAAAQAEVLGISAEDRLRELRDEVPLGRHGTPEDVADVVSWLISDDSRYVHGQTIAVNGGLTFS